MLFRSPGKRDSASSSRNSTFSLASASAPTSPSFPPATFPSNLFAAVASALRSNYGQEEARLVYFLSIQHHGLSAPSSHDLALCLLSALLDGGGSDPRSVARPTDCHADFKSRYQGPHLSPCQWSWQIVEPLDLHRPPREGADLRRGFDLDITSQVRTSSSADSASSSSHLPLKDSPMCPLCFWSKVCLILRES